MKTSRTPHAIFAVLTIALLAGGNICAAESGTPSDTLSDDALKATSERIRQTGQQMQRDIQEKLERLRKERAALVARQAAERKQETERARQQAEKDRAALAAAKESKQREALLASQEKARREAAVRAAELEQTRLAALKEKEDEEAALERAQKESLDAYKAGSKQQKLGTQAQFGVDI
jgi:hypothetical protein